MVFAEKLVAGTVPDIKPPVRKKLQAFVRVITSLRADANSVSSPNFSLADVDQRDCP